MFMNRNQLLGEHREIAAPKTGFVPLWTEGRTHVETACAAYHLGRKPQTLRAWASTESGPIRPIRINKRLAWPIAAILKLQSGS